MEKREILLIPQPNSWQFRLIFGGLFLVISMTGLYYSVRGILKFGFSTDCYFSVYIVGTIFSLLAIFLQRTHEFNQQNQLLVTYWAIGLPIRVLFKKLPLIWRKYPGKSISKLKIYRISKADSDDFSGKTRYISYHVKAKLGREMLYLVHDNDLVKALDIAWEIGEFIGVPVDDSSL